MLTDYIVWGLSVPLALVALILLLLYRIIRHLRRQEEHDRIHVLTMIFAGILLLVSFFNNGTLGYTLGSMKLLYQYPERITGQITKLEPGPGFLIHPEAEPVLVTMDGQTYYLPKAPDLTVGQWVNIQYEPSSHAAIAYRILTEEEAAKGFVSLFEAPPMKILTANQIIIVGNFLAFALWTVLYRLVAHRFRPHELDEDEPDEFGIRPRLIGFLDVYLIILYEAALILLEDKLNFSYQSNIFILIVIFGYLVYALTFRIYFEDGQLVVRRLFLKKRYSVRSVTYIKWETDMKDSTVRLAIKLPDERSEISIPAHRYYGIRDTYRRIHRIKRIM